MRRGFRVDYVGFGFTALGLGCLQVVLDKGQEEDWFGSHFIILFATLAVLGILGMVVWETFVADDPIVDLRLMVSNVNLASSMVLQFIMGFILNSTTVLLPQFVQQMLGYNATHAGLILMPGGFTLMVMMPVAGASSSSVQPKYLMAVGLGITAASMFYLTGFNTEVSFRHLVYTRIFQCIGLPLFFIPLNTIAYGNLPPGKNNSASALMNLMRNLGGGLGISIAITMLTRRTQLHQERIASHLTPYDAPFIERLHAMGGASQRTMMAIYAQVQQQALMLSYIDVFKVMAIGCLIVLALILTLRKIKLGGKTVAVH